MIKKKPEQTHPVDNWKDTDKICYQIFVSNHRIYFVQIHIEEENTHEDRSNNTYIKDENWGLRRVGAFDIDGASKPYHK